MSALLEVQDLRAAYGRIPVLHGISFAVGAGEFVGILGHNGMGKTSLLRALIGLLPTTGGNVRFAGADITRLSPDRRARLGLGYVPQGREIFPALTVRDNLRMGCARERDDRPVIDQVLQDFPRLVPLLDRQGAALSGGEQQLLAIARALCGRPRLLLLDEPSEGIQPSIVEEIADLLHRLKASGLAVILVEQNLDFVTQLADRTLVIQKGAIAANPVFEESL